MQVCVCMHTYMLHTIITYKGLAHMTAEAEESHDLSSVSGNIGGVILV